MLNKMLALIRRYDMITPGDRVICAVSGGADSMALLWAMYLLREKLQIQLCAAHFNHGLRGAESDRDEAFVRQFCHDYGVEYFAGRADVVAGKKGLEAAARQARYDYFATLDGTVATAHTADDNAETVLMHLVRGTGLKGLGGICPVRENLIRPLLTVTRQEVLSFLEEYHIPYVQDSSNGTDAFLRNRLRHHVMPLLKQENPRLAQNLSAMAMELRQDEQMLTEQALKEDMTVWQLRKLDPALRSRKLAAFLEEAGVIEPERQHILQAEGLVFSDNPSAWAEFPGGVRICRCYDRLLVGAEQKELPVTVLSGPGVTQIPGFRVHCLVATEGLSVQPEGRIVIRSRKPADAVRLSGGTKPLKKLFIDRKIPALSRMGIPVVADDRGVLWVYGIGPNLDRLAQEGSGIQFRFEKTE